DNQRQDHLAKIGPVVLGIAMLAECLAAFAVERKARRVHEDGGKIGKEIAPPVGQPPLDHLLDATRSQRLLALLLHLLTEPGHGAVEMMQVQSRGAGNVVILHPGPAIAIRARHEYPCRVATNTARSTANSKARSFNRSPRTWARPSRSHILPNSNGPPMRFAETDSAPSASSSSALMRSTRSVSLAPEASNEANAPEAASSSARPRLAMTDWRTAPSMRLFSTI